MRYQEPCPNVIVTVKMFLMIRAGREGIDFNLKMKMKSHQNFKSDTVLLGRNRLKAIDYTLLPTLCTHVGF